jgi:hypothetical protein
MKRVHFAVTICLALASASPAFARTGWTAPVNGTASSVMMSTGGVMMEITLPPAEFEAIGRDMKLRHNTCIIQDADAGAADSMILVCGPAGSKVQ